jgi:hypothetical protein
MLKRSLLMFIAILPLTASAELKRASAASSETLRSLPVVKTWRELLDCPVIELKSGPKVRLGIEALKAPHGSTPLLYACVENYEPHIREDEHQLGPLHVEVTGPEQSEVQKRAEDLIKKNEESLNHHDEYALFVMPLAINQTGEHHIIISEATNREDIGNIAEFKVEGTTEQYHSWFAVAPEMSAHADDEGFRLTGPFNGPAYPSIEDRPVEYRKKSLAVDDEPRVLPRILDVIEEVAPRSVVDSAQRLFPQLAEEEFEIREGATIKLAHMGAAIRPLLLELKQSTKDAEVKLRAATLLSRLANSSVPTGFRGRHDKFTIKKTGDQILLEMNEEFITSECEDHFLARWWVNGEPFVSAGPDELFGGSKQVEDARGNSVPMKVCLDLQKLGAKPGDTIGVQLLYCPSGFQHLEYENERASRLDNEPAAPIASNKIEFTAAAGTSDQ